MIFLTQTNTISKFLEVTGEKESVIDSMLDNISKIFIGLSIFGAVVLLIGLFVFIYCKIAKKKESISFMLTLCGSVMVVAPLLALYITTAKPGSSTYISNDSDGVPWPIIMIALCMFSLCITSRKNNSSDHKDK